MSTKFILLDTDNGWRSGRGLQTASVGTVLSLKAEPDGPLGLRSSDGSLGRLRLPRRLALGENDTPYLLVGGSNPHILRFNRARQTFVPLAGMEAIQPDTTGSCSSGVKRQARGLDNPTRIVFVGRSLYLADRERVRIFDSRTLALLAIFLVPGAHHIDLAADAGQAYIMTARHVYRHRPGQACWTPIINAKTTPGLWTDITLTRRGDILLWNGAVLEKYDTRGVKIAAFTDAGDVRGECDTPPLFVDHHNRFYIPPELADSCNPRLSQTPIQPESREWVAAMRSLDSLVFSYEDGHRVALKAARSFIDESNPANLYLREGHWQSAALKSGDVRCQWDSVEVVLDLPPGSSIEAATYTSQTAYDSGSILPSQWDTGCRMGGGIQAPDAREPLKKTFLIRSRPGQYCYLRLTLRGDGRVSPNVRQLKVSYPRVSYLKHLPEEYSRNEASREFLEHYLAIFQAEWDTLEARIADFATLVDPRCVPEGEAMEYLASWLGLPLEGGWTWEQNRRLLAAAPRITGQRGTLEGLRAVVQVYLENMIGLKPAQQKLYPVIIEGYRERYFAALAAHERPLWGAAVVRRLHSDVYATEGEIELVSTGDPERDLFHEFAHRFRVFVPAVWVRSDEDELRLRRALDAEKPAHTEYELILVPAGVIIGARSTLGVDMILSDRAPLQLGRDALDASKRLAGDEDEHNRLAPGLPLW